jgi:hypothetical protein
LTGGMGGVGVGGSPGGSRTMAWVASVRGPGDGAEVGEPGAMPGEEAETYSEGPSAVGVRRVEAVGVQLPRASIDRASTT